MTVNFYICPGKSLVKMTDEEYIKANFKDATESQILALVERIAIMIVDGCVEEENAREWALFGKYEG
jgi:hypothetical protein